MVSAFLVGLWLNICSFCCRAPVHFAIGILLISSSVSSVSAQVVSSPSSWMPPDPPPGFSVPADLFTNRTSSDSVSLIISSQVTEILPANISVGGASLQLNSAWQPFVYLYASPATHAYFLSSGLDGKLNLRVWETLLRKYQIPFRPINSVTQLELISPGVLIMPSAVVLTQREKQAVLSFRAKGGSVLASWLTGVRSENSAWLGFDFMEKALDVKVVGTTQNDNDDFFLTLYGDSPVTYHLPAGQRIWTERPKEWYPLRLVGRNPVGYMLNWSRQYALNKAAASIVFDERRQHTGAMSRSVVLGYPERLWLGADRKQLDTVAHDALEWLLRRPSAYVAAWPYPYSSAFVLAVNATDVIDGKDIELARLYEDIGARATYYAVGELAPASASILKRLQDRGHELGYLGDTFNGFKGQTVTTQTKRLDAMRKDFKDSGLTLTTDAGFYPPADSYDKTTEMLLVERRFGHYIASFGATDARLPVLIVPETAVDQPIKHTVVLPQTQIGPDEALEGNDSKSAMSIFLAELEFASKMGGLLVGRASNPSLLTQRQWGEFIQYLKTRRERMWLATGGQVADWWRERNKVTINLDSGPAELQLSVTVKGGTSLQQAVAVLINMPESGSKLRALPENGNQHSAKVETVDAWRSAIVLTSLPPGKYVWALHFDRPKVR